MVEMDKTIFEKPTMRFADNKNSFWNLTIYAFVFIFPGINNRWKSPTDYKFPANFCSTHKHWHKKARARQIPLL